MGCAAGQGITELEGDMQTLHNLLSEAGPLVTTLQEAMAGPAEAVPIRSPATSASLPSNWALSGEGARCVASSFGNALPV